MTTMQELVEEIDRRSEKRKFGQLQEARKIVRSLARKPSKVPFGGANHDLWAFHKGGRDELQFNVGVEEPIGLEKHDLRFGVAFSFDLSHSLPSIEPLVPKVGLFNDYIRQNPEDVAGMWMWYHLNGTRSVPTRPVPIEDNLVRPGVFVFMGKTGSLETPEYEYIIGTFEELLPIWEFIEQSHSSNPLSTFYLPEKAPLRPGFELGVTSTQATVVGGTLSIELRHKHLQKALYDELINWHGEDSVYSECRLSASYCQIWCPSAPHAAA